MSETYFIINTAVANVYRDGDFNSPIVTQALLGETCSVLHETNKWIQIQQWDHYTGWVNRGQGILKDEPYSHTKRYMDLHGQITSPDNSCLRNITFGGQIQMNGSGVILPDGKEGKIQGSIGDFNDHLTRESVLQLATRFLGTPYFWGGKSPTGFDCSGFVQTVFQAHGIELKRDARDQVNMEIIKDISFGDISPGDLIYFGKDAITHVAISLGGFGIIHSQGWVKKDSLNPDDENANNELIESLQTVKSISNLI